MKSKCIFYTALAVVPCLAQSQHAASLLGEQQGLEVGAAKIIHGIRGAEQALAKDLHSHPQLLLSEEQLLHKASMLALKAGEMRAKQMHSSKRLNDIEASLMQNVAASSQSSGAAAQFQSLATKQASLLRGGKGILDEVTGLKENFQQEFGETNPEVTGQLEQLMDRVDGAQRDILKSESEATAHASELAAAIRNDRAPRAKAFTQESSEEATGTKDPAKRLKLAKDAVSELKIAKSEVFEAFGNEDGNAEKVEGMIDQLKGSLQGLADQTQQEISGDEAEVIASIEAHRVAKEYKKRKAMASLAQEAAHARASSRMKARRYRRQGLRLHRIAQRTRGLARADHHIAKETRFARQVVEEELGDTEVGEEVSDLLSEAAADAGKAAASDRHLSAVEDRQGRGLAHMAALLQN